MNIKTIGIIISREYLNKVKKKSFLITTFVVPVLMAALCIVPIVMMMTSKEKAKTVAVVDNSGIVLPFLTESETLKFVDMTGQNVDSLKAWMADMNVSAVLNISEITEDKSVVAGLTSQKPLGIDMTENISRRINDAVESYRIDSYQIEGLADILEDVKSNVRLSTYTIDDTGEEKITEAGVNTVLSMGLGLLLFLFITLFGGMVMSAVIEEKASRVVEVLVSSVKATELMFGKIIGIAAVALTQFLLWIVLTLVLVGAAGLAMGQDLLGSIDASEVTQMASGTGVEALPVQDSAISDVLATLQGIDFGGIILVFLVFFVFGYMLYASMFAAIGSAAENEGDTQQLQLPVTIPLMIGYFIAIYAFKAPDSAIAFWGSIIPFTSPIVMLARFPFGVDAWELILSIVLLILTTGFMAWLSAKIYKVGILMFGKKTTWKDLWKWLRQN
ncbi:MAG: ABC transporter permease [Bacteroidales bacterium]|nr:ABC transporter permease [Bacteroidales bacterium]